MIKQDNDEMLSILLGIRMDLSSKSIASRTQAFGNPAVELTKAWRQPIHRAASATVGGITASDWRRVDVARCLQRSSSCCIDVVITPASSQPHLNFISERFLKCDDSGCSRSVRPTGEADEDEAPSVVELPFQQYY